MQRLSQHIGHPEGKNDGDHHGNDLNAKLGRIAKEQTVAPVGIDGHGSE
jgi:hypothetical protein